MAIETKRVMILGCARCGADHEIEFRHFVGRSFQDADGVVYGWWGPCTVTGDPVLMTNKSVNLVNPLPDSELPRPGNEFTHPNEGSAL